MSLNKNDGDIIQGTDFDTLTQGAKNYGTINGFAVDVSGALVARIAPGSAVINGVSVARAGSQYLTLNAADASLNRYDLIELSGTDATAIFTAGTARAGSPQVPDGNTARIPIAVASVTSGLTEMQNSNYRDVRTEVQKNEYTQLFDTDNAYTGTKNKVPAVTLAEDQLVFQDLSPLNWQVGDGTAGSLTISADTTQAATADDHYTNVLIASGVTYTIRNNSIFRCTGSFICEFATLVPEKVSPGGIGGSAVNGCANFAGDGGSSAGGFFIYANEVIVGETSTWTSTGQNGLNGSDASFAAGGGNRDNGLAGSDGIDAFWHDTRDDTAGEGGNGGNGATGGASVAQGAVPSGVFIKTISRLFSPYWFPDKSSSGGGGGSGATEKQGTLSSRAGGAGGNGGTFWGVGGEAGSGGITDQSNGTGVGGAGGGGAAAGGFVGLAFRDIDNPGSLTISVDGGIGGSGAAPGEADSGPGAGGGGGGGGLVIIVGSGAGGIVVNTSGGVGGVIGSGGFTASGAQAGNAGGSGLSLIRTL